jgi:hypothetical protein
MFSMAQRGCAFWHVIHQAEARATISVVVSDSETTNPAMALAKQVAVSM